MGLRAKWVVLLLAVTAEFACAIVPSSFASGYPRFKPGSTTQTTTIIQIKFNQSWSPAPNVVGCGLIADATPFDVVPLNASDIIHWIRHDPGRVIHAISTNVSSLSDMVEIQLMVIPSEHPERDFEVMCATIDLATDAVAATHLHLQLDSFNGFYPRTLAAQELYYYVNPVTYQGMEDNVQGVDVILKSPSNQPRVSLFDIPIRTVRATNTSFSIAILQTATTSDGFYGYTDGTTIWGAYITTRSVEFYMADYSNPLSVAMGSSLNPLGVYSFADRLASNQYNLTFTISRATRQVTATLVRGSATVTSTVTDLQRSRFPTGAMRAIGFSMVASSTFRLYSVATAMTYSHDTTMTTQLLDLYPIDIDNMYDSVLSGSELLTSSAAVFTGLTRYQRLMTVPLDFISKFSDTFSLTITYSSVSSLTPVNDVMLGITNGTFVWYGTRTWSYQQGGYCTFNTSSSTVCNSPVAIGYQQGVSFDNSEPFDVELWRPPCSGCWSNATSPSPSGYINGVIRTVSGWVTWDQEMASQQPTGRVSLITLKPQSTSPTTEAVKFIRLQLYAVDQWQPGVILLTRTQFPHCNHTTPFIAVFTEPVMGFGNASLDIVNAVISSPPTPVDPSYPIEWMFRLQPVAQGAFSVGILANSFTDLNGYSNPDPSETVWFLFDDIPPVVVSIIPSIPITPYVNMVTLNKTIFTITFGEAPYTNFTASCVEVVNGYARNVTKVSSTVYTFQITPYHNIQTMIRLPWGSIKDNAGNGNLATDWITFIYDDVSPTAIITAPLPRYVNRTVAEHTNFTIMFDKIIASFDETRLTILPGAARNATQVTPDRVGYNFTLSVDPSFHDGIVNVTLPFGSITDRALDPGLPTFLTFEFDDTRPSVDLETYIRFPTNNTRVNVTANFTEHILPSSITNASLTVTGGYTLNYSIITNSSNRLGPFVASFIVVPTTQGSITVTMNAGAVLDMASNPNLQSSYQHNPSQSSVRFIFDSVRPKATITTNTPSFSNHLLPYNVTFSEHVMWFGPSNVTVSGGVVANVTKGYGNSYAVIITPSVQQDYIAVNLSANVTVDDALNGLMATSTVKRFYDIIPPHMNASGSMIGQRQITQFTLAPFLIVFSKYVTTDANKEDFQVHNANVTSFSLVSAATDTRGPVYSMTLFPDLDDGIITIFCPDSVYYDKSGNGNLPFMYSFRYHLVYDPGWPLALKVMVVLLPIACCLGSIGTAFYCWLKLPPLVKIPDEPVEEFDTRKAIAEMKEALAEEEARARRIKLGLEEPPPEPVKIVLENPLPPTLTPRTGGFSVQMMGDARSSLAVTIPTRGDSIHAGYRDEPVDEGDGRDLMIANPLDPRRMASPSPGGRLNSSRSLLKKKGSMKDAVVFPDDFSAARSVALSPSGLSLTASGWNEIDTKSSPVHVGRGPNGAKKSYYPATRAAELY